MKVVASVKYSKFENQLPIEFSLSVPRIETKARFCARSCDTKVRGTLAAAQSSPLHQSYSWWCRMFLRWSQPLRRCLVTLCCANVLCRLWKRSCPPHKTPPCLGDWCQSLGRRGPRARCPIARTSAVQLRAIPSNFLLGQGSGCCRRLWWRSCRRNLRHNCSREIRTCSHERWQVGTDSRIGVCGHGQRAVR